MSAVIAENIASHVYHDTDPSGLAEIYQPEVNLAIWQRSLDASLKQDVDFILAKYTSFAWRSIVAADEVSDWLTSRMKGAATDFIDDVQMQVEMFADLFDLKQIGLRLELLDKTMCPRFHIDKLMCRMITTYQGPATEWLPNQCADRSKLGPASAGLSDDQSGIYQQATDIEQAQVGDILLMKGAIWARQEVGALIHRSPQASQQQRRLVLSLDFAD